MDTKKNPANTKVFTQLTLNDDIREKRIRHGIARCDGECYICGIHVDGCQELQEATRTIFNLCDKCSDEYNNVRITIAARYGWIYMHSWHGIIAKIRRSSGVVHDAKIIAIENGIIDGQKYPMFRCIWNEPKNGNGHTVPDHKFLHQHQDYSTRLVDYKTLRELNPHLKDPESVKFFENIPIHESFQKMVDETITFMKANKPTIYTKDIYDFRNQYIAEGKSIFMLPNPIN